MADPAVIPDGSVGRGIVCELQTVVLRGWNPGTARDMITFVLAFERMSRRVFVFLNRLNSMAILAGRVGLELGLLKFRA